MNMKGANENIAPEGF